VFGVCGLWFVLCCVDQFKVQFEVSEERGGWRFGVSINFRRYIRTNKIFISLSEHFTSSYSKMRSYLRE
jgi:hypothetical protein